MAEGEPSVESPVEVVPQLEAELQPVAVEQQSASPAESPPTVMQGSKKLSTKITKLVMDGFKSFGRHTELLFGDDFNVVLGPNGSGKCLTGDANVLLADGSLVRIDELVNERLAGASRMDDGWIAGGDGTKVLTLGRDLRIHARPVKAFVKRTAPDTLVRVHTRSGRKVTSTPYHPLFVMKNGAVEAVRADALREGIRIAVPRSIPIKTPDKAFVDFMDVISESDGLYVPWSDETETVIREKNTGRTFRQLEIVARIPRRIVHSFFEKQAINFAYLVRILRTLNLPDRDIMSRIQFVKAKNSQILCRIPWHNSPELSRVLGYLLAEGRFPPKSCQLWFTNGTEEIVQDYYMCLTAVFGIRATINEYKAGSWDILAYSQPARIILKKLGMAVDGTIRKTVASVFLKHAGREEISALLNGLYSGDGYVSPSSIELTTKSPDLAYVVETMLLRLGMQPRIKKVVKVATNSGFSGEYYNVVLYGVENFTVFADQILFAHPDKARRVKELLGKKPNPNVDLLEVNDLVKRAVNEQHLSVKGLREKFPRLDACVYGQCLPSRIGVQQLVEEVFDSSRTTQTLSTLCMSDVFWDEIVSLEAVKACDPWVYDLCVEHDHNFIANNIFVHNSNIIDSLCFVLGRSSSKSLRAEKSAHLIYNGGKTKQPAKSAEVSIFFDNSTKIFPVADAEIKITRIVRSDGLSRYKINNITKTRQELTELLSHARIDPDGYNIILQGDIVRLVEMNAVERRQIVEEIAGISVYEEKKQQALNELTKVDEKLNEADIILKERDGYLKDLRKDRDQALAYKELNDLIRTNKASSLKISLDKKAHSLQSLQDRMGKHKESLAHFQEKIKEVQDRIAEQKNKINEINTTIEQKGEVEQVAVQKEVEAVRIDIATLKTKISGAQAEISKVQNRKPELDKNLEDVQQKVQEHQARDGDLSAQHDTLFDHVQRLERDMIDFRARHQLGEGAKLDSDIEGVDRKIEDLQKDLQGLRERQQSVIREKDKLEFQMQTVDTQIQKMKAVEEEHKQDIELLKNRKTEFKKVLLELNDVLNQDSSMAGELAGLREKAESVREEHAKLAVKQTTIQESIAGNIAVKKILESKGEFGQVHGTVAELGRSNSKYSLALEIAAGPKIHSVVVDDDKTGARCIRYLRENKLGVATFLPLNKIKGQPSSEEARKLSHSPGVLGLAVDLIEFDPQYKTVFSFVFGNTLVVDKLETARRIGIGAHKMVTLDGDLCETSGAMVGGFRHKKTGSFKDQDLSAKLEKLASVIEMSEQQIAEMTQRRTINDERITKLRNLKAELEADIIKTEKSLHLDTSDTEASASYKEELRQQLVKVTQELEDMQNVVQEKTALLADLKIEKQRLRDQVNELRNPAVLAELTALESKHKELREQLQKIDADQHALRIQLKDVLLRDQDNMKKVRKEAEREEQEFAGVMKALQQQVKAQEKVLSEKEKEQQKFFAQYKALFEERNECTQAVNGLETRVLGVEEKARAEELALNGFSLEEAKLRTEHAAVEAEFANFAGVPLNLNKSEDALKQEIYNAERRLANIGAVNMRALDIYDVAEKEYKTLVDKKQKLGEEKVCVVNLLQEVEGQKKGLFQKALEEVGKNFSTIFSKLSTKGSSASLELENVQEPFEGGLRIRVKLTGQKYLDIRSLSGGEKTMTALAFLFALQEHEPASFYVLDEVDAALDKANSEKLAQLIRHYTSHAQYIVISHNDAVITEGDVLFGVSMHADQGMSNVVSLKA